MPPREGIDVSHHQNDAGGGGLNAIRWPQVGADGAKFCFVKISERMSPDAFAATNLKRARDAGLLVGGYHFMRNTATGASQAAAFLDAVELLPGDLLPALDVEIVPSSAAARAALVDRCREWISVVREAIGGKHPFLYTRAGVWNALDKTSDFAACPLWLARYSAKPPEIPTGWLNYVVWQFSDKGKIDGITGKIDENALNVSFSKFKKSYTI